MRDWLSYKAQDFVPFTHDVYFRVIERTGETLWPWLKWNKGHCSRSACST